MSKNKSHIISWDMEVVQVFDHVDSSKGLFTMLYNYVSENLCEAKC